MMTNDLRDTLDRAMPLYLAGAAKLVAGRRAELTPGESAAVRAMCQVMTSIGQANAEPIRTILPLVARMSREQNPGATAKPTKGQHRAAVMSRNAFFAGEPGEVYDDHLDARRTQAAFSAKPITADDNG